MRVLPLVLLLALAGCDTGEPDPHVEPPLFGTFEATVALDGTSEAWLGDATFAFFGAGDAYQFIVTMARVDMRSHSLNFALSVEEASPPPPGTYPLGEPGSGPLRSLFSLLAPDGFSTADSGRVVIEVSDEEVVRGSFEAYGREGLSGPGAPPGGPPFSTTGTFEAVPLRLNPGPDAPGARPSR